MKIEQLIKEFNNGATEGSASGNRLRIEGNKLINYKTIIAYRDEYNNFHLNKRYYSRTTSKIQNYCRKYFDIFTEYEGPEAQIFYMW